MESDFFLTAERSLIELNRKRSYLITDYFYKSNNFVNIAKYYVRCYNKKRGTQRYLKDFLTKEIYKWTIKRLLWKNTPNGREK